MRGTASRLSSILLVHLLVSAGPTHAHTGLTAVALPISNIVIDGDLSDWPRGLKAYELLAYDPATDERVSTPPGDTSGHFWVGFDRASGHLYVALRVTDDRVILEGAAGEPWNAQDSSEVFIDVEHRASMRQPTQFYYRRAPGSYPHGRAQLAEVVRSTSNGQIVYEWRIDLAGLGGQMAASGDRVIGFDILFTDRDGPSDVMSVLWGPGTEKWQNSLQLGDLMLLDREPEFGVIEGTSTWDGGSDPPSLAARPSQASARPAGQPKAGVRPSESATDEKPVERLAPGYVHIRRDGRSDFFVHASADDQGRFAVRVPPGDYEVNAADPRTLVRFGERKNVALRAGQRVQAGALAARSPSSLEDLVPSLLVEYQVPGAAVAVIEEGKVAYVGAFGRGEYGSPITHDTAFRVASLTKPVSAVVAYTLLARNEWSLDEALSKYWVDPDVRGDKRHQRITSRMALMHQTGLPNWRQSSRLSFSFTPGDRWQYSGEGFEYMRRALERKTGRSLEDLAKALIFEPLGMKRTSFVWPAWAHSRFAGEHDAAGQPMAYATPYEPNAAANMISSIDDYARFAVHVLNGAGVPTDLFKDMTSAQTRPANPLDGEYWGVGWGVLKERDPHDDIVWHGGGQPGIRTIVMLQPARRRGVVVFTNATGGSPLIYAVVNATLNKDGRLRTLERSLSRQNRIPRVLESRDSTNTTCGTCGTSGPFP